MRRILGTVLRLLGISLYGLRLHPLVIRMGRKCPKVLVYHSCDPVESPYVEGLWTNTPPDDLASHLDYLQRYYEVVSLACLESGDRPEGAVVITFDDGYRSVYSNAFPLMEERGLQATIYVITEAVDNNALVWVNELVYLLSRFPQRCRSIAAGALGVSRRASIARIVDRARSTYSREAIGRLISELRIAAGVEETAGGDGATTPIEPPLYVSREEIRRMAKAGFTFGSHTVCHPNLARLGGTDLRAELVASRDFVLDLPGGRATLAYPFGDHTSETRELATQLGYTSIMEVGGTNNPVDLRRVARIPVGSGSPARLFAEMEIVTAFKAFLRHWSDRLSGA